MADFVGAGWKPYPGNDTLHIGRLPGRKSICLYKVSGSALSVLAYFRDQDSAEQAMGLLDRLTGIGSCGEASRA